MIAPDQLDQDRFLGFEVVIQASREDSGGVGNLVEGGTQARGGDQRSRRLQDLGSPSSIGLGTRHGRAGALDSSSPLRCHGYAVMPSRSQRPRTSSKIDIGTVNGSVADTEVRWAATSSAVGLLPGSASQPSPRPTKTRAKRPAQAE